MSLVRPRLFPSAGLLTGRAACLPGYLALGLQSKRSIRLRLRHHKLNSACKKRPAGTGLAGRSGFQQALTHGFSRRLRRRVSVCRLLVLLRSERRWSAAELLLMRRSAERIV